MSWASGSLCSWRGFVRGQVTEPPIIIPSWNAREFARGKAMSEIKSGIKKIINKSQIVFGLSDCFRTPFFWCIKQIVCPPLRRKISTTNTTQQTNHSY